MSMESASDVRSNTTASTLIGNSIGGSGQSLTQASCTLCRRRKIKCDRSLPCGNCQRTGAECVPYTPSRAPRGRQGGRKRKRDDGELLERLAKLEGMVKDIEGQEIATSFQQDKTVSDQIPSFKPLNADEPTSVPVRGMDKYMASSFWVNLTEEIKGLKDVLGGSSNDDEDNDDGRTPVSGSSISGRQHTLSSNHSGFVLSHVALSENSVDPTQHQVYTLCDVYLANVDPVFKLLHGPSLRKYLQENATELDGSPGPGGLEALRFAIYYVAITSLADGECKHRIGEDKGILLIRYRAATESALAKADFINTVEISTLQALAIYLVAVRANDTSRCMWTLISVAIRIAQAMGLHYDTTSASLSPFERELRRRLWWQICDLDTNAAADRASHPVIFANSFNTRLPMQINDEDINLNSCAEVEEREGFTDMTFTLSCNEIFDALRKLNHVPLREISQQQAAPQETWSQRIDTVVQFQRSVEQKYLCRLNLIRPFHWFTRMVADIVTATMWLFVYRPVQRYPKSNGPSQSVDPGILRLSVDVLERAQQLITDPAGSQFKWVSQIYVQWHALSVAAAELCVNTEGPIVEKAWTIIEPAFAQAARHVADSDTGMLWRPIKKLMTRAREVRQRHLSSQSPPISTFPAIQSRDVKTTDGNTTNLNFAQSSLGGSPFSMQGLHQQAPITPAAPFDWDPWLTAATATDPTAYEDKYNPELHEMAWTNWQGFIDDVQGQENAKSGPFSMPL